MSKMCWNYITMSAFKWKHDSLHWQCMWFNTIIPFQPSIRWRWNVFMDVFILCNIYGCHCLGQGSLEKDISIWMGFSTQWNKNILSVLCCTVEKFSWIICCHFPLLMSFVVRVKALWKADILYILYCPHTDGWLLPTYIMVFFMFCCLFCPNDECKGGNKTLIHYAIKNVAEPREEHVLCVCFPFMTKVATINGKMMLMEKKKICTTEIWTLICQSLFHTTPHPLVLRYD